MTKVFISYTRRGDYDRQFADYLRGQLQAWGFQPWMDVYDIPGGDHWDDSIDSALKTSDVVLGLLSPASVESDNVKNEWAWALQKGKLQLLLLAPCEIPHRFIRIDYTDFSRDRNAAMARLHKILTSPELQRTTTNTHLPGALKRVSNTFRAVPAAANRTMAKGGLPRGLLIGGLLGAGLVIVACVALGLLLVLNNFNGGNLGSTGVQQQVSGNNNVDTASAFITHIFNGDSIAASNLACAERRLQLKLEIDQIILQFEAIGGIQMSNITCRESGSDEVQCHYDVFSPATGLSDTVSLRLPMNGGFVCPTSMSFLTE
ncbi:MAG: toll/interleukin-1 receptor domain-containing protein [Anaerolineae bacterium]